MSLSAITHTTASFSPNRPDIFGLRGLALLAVIIFHINKNLIPGFIIGVDMFFVMSGFLITQQILKAIERDKFSLREFYARRVKRLALPLLLMIAVVLLAAAILMIARDFNAAANSALFSLLSLANVYFWLFQNGGYFGIESQSLPFLHLWSLGVIEQFYIFWPILLLFTYRKVRTQTFFILTAFGAFASFSFGEVWFYQDAAFAYYMLPARMGEFLMGGLVAILVVREVHLGVPKKLITPIAAIGLLLLLVSFFYLNETQAIPGIRAMIPTLGVALLIFAGYSGRNVISRLFEFKPLAWLGLVSYSAYLWHWPLLAILNYEHIPINWLTGSLVLGVTVFLAFVSYTLVEVPGQLWDASVSRIVMFQYIVPASLIAVLTVLAQFYLGSNLQASELNRVNSTQADRARQAATSAARPLVDATKSPQSLQTMAELDTGLTGLPRAAFEFDYVCQREQLALSDTQDKRCVLGGGDLTAPRVLLWGDSNAAHYVGVVGAIAKQAGFSFRNVAIDACPPIFDDPAPFVLARRLADCRASKDAVAAALNRAEVVIIGAGWTSYAARSNKIFAATFATIQSLTAQGKLVIIMGKSPVMMSFDAHCKDKAAKLGIEQTCQSKDELMEEVKRANAELKAFAARTPNVDYFDVTPYLCRDTTCSATDVKGNAIYYDAGHISMPGSWKIGESILRQSGVPSAFARITPWLNQASKK